MAKLDACLTVKEAAEYLGVSPNTLRNWGEEGKVPIYRNPINNYRLFKINDMDALVKRIDRTAKRKSAGTRRSKLR
ncbi:MAG: helix-turn-helix domain-containing protein [Pirellulaceae bacterium]|nr:helix-turn-helix domain-containing protein [Pirellulaceae bacterium]